MQLILIDFLMDKNEYHTTNQPVLINFLRSKLQQAQDLANLFQTKQLKFLQIPSEYLNFGICDNFTLAKYLIELGSEEIWYYKRFSYHIRTNKEIAVKACQLNGYVMKHVGPVLRNDKDVALAAVNSNPYAVRYFSWKLKRDPILMLDCVCEANYRMLPNELRLDKEFNVQLLARKRIWVGYLCKELRDDIDIRRELLIYHYYESFSRYYSLFFNDKQVIMKVLDRYKVRDVVPPILSFISPELRNDREIVIKAVKRNQVEYDYIENEELRRDIEVLTAYSYSTNKKLEFYKYK